MQTQMSISMPMMQPLKLTEKSILIKNHENALTKAKEWLDESKLTLN